MLAWAQRSGMTPERQRLPQIRHGLAGPGAPPYAVGTMVKFASLIGALVGLTVQLVFTEWLYGDTFSHHELLEISIGAALLVAGALAGRALARRLTNGHRNVKPS